MDADQHGSRMIIMDNVGFHRSQEVTEMIEDSGHKGILQPAYTPAFNLCEKIFGHVKQIVRKKLSPDVNILDNHIHRTFDSVKHSTIRAYYRQVIEWMQVASTGRAVDLNHSSRQALEQAQEEDRMRNLSNQSNQASNTDEINNQSRQEANRSRILPNGRARPSRTATERNNARMLNREHRLADEQAGYEENPLEQHHFHEDQVELRHRRVDPLPERRTQRSVNRGRQRGNRRQSNPNRSSQTQPDTSLVDQVNEFAEDHYPIHPTGSQFDESQTQSQSIQQMNQFDQSQTQIASQSMLPPSQFADNSPYPLRLMNANDPSSYTMSPSMLYGNHPPLM
ncbi:unnamed protein product [Sympodiomycopsis kandeliae]